jgi:hypothetical protein
LLCCRVPTNTARQCPLSSTASCHAGQRDFEGPPPPAIHAQQLGEGRGLQPLVLRPCPAGPVTGGQRLGYGPEPSGQHDARCSSPGFRPAVSGSVPVHTTRIPGQALAPAQCWHGGVVRVCTVSVRGDGCSQALGVATSAPQLSHSLLRCVHCRANRDKAPRTRSSP